MQSTSWWWTTSPTRWLRFRPRAVRGTSRRPATRRSPACCATTPVVNYVRRAVLDPSEDRLHLLDALIELTRREITALRGSGVASTKRPESTQILGVLIRQMGELLLQPMVDAVWDRVAKPTDARKPRLRITVEN